ncbi:MAG TPA: trigger factor, partial [Candidatus Blautia pullicola]|nr:trigger factor [Candidatus Blautia pullicola]
ASENTDFKTAEEYRANQKELLQQQADNEYESQVKSDLFQLVMETTEVKEYPQELLEETRADLKSQLDNMYSASYGMTMDEYLESQGASKEDADQTIDETAKSYLKQNMVTQAILNAAKKEYTEEDYQEELEKFAVLSGFSDGASMEAMYSDVTVLKDNVLWNAATDIIMSTANIKEGQE